MSLFLTRDISFVKGELDMGPNLVRVRKLEFLYRVLEVRRSSKFEPKFASLKFHFFIIIFSVFRFLKVFFKKIGEEKDAIFRQSYRFGVLLLT